MLKLIDVAEAGIRAEPPALDEADVKRVFKVLHGYYGNLFLSKFSTGSVNPQGEDHGIANARRIWAFGLREFDGETIKAALLRCQERHPEFPPGLPQFAALCRAVKPRGTYAAIGFEMSQEKRSAYAQAARQAIAKRVARRAGADDGCQTGAAGLDGLKQAIANAIGIAGGDEAAALVRLDQTFSTRSRA